MISLLLLAAQIAMPQEGIRRGNSGALEIRIVIASACAARVDPSVRPKGANAADAATAHGRSLVNAIAVDCDGAVKPPFVVKMTPASAQRPRTAIISF